MLLQQQTFSKKYLPLVEKFKVKVQFEKSSLFKKKLWLILCDKWLHFLYSHPQKIVIQYPIFHGKNLFRRFLQTYCQIIHSPKILFRRENHLETKTFVNSLLRFGTQTFSIFLIQNNISYSKILKTCNFCQFINLSLSKEPDKQKNDLFWLEMILEAKLDFIFGLIKGSNLQNIHKCVLLRSISRKKTLKNRNETMNSLLRLQGSSMALMATISRFSHHISWHAWNDNDWGW